MELRILLLIVASVWFFPISCTTFTIAGIQALSMYEERNMLLGEQPYSIFYVLLHNQNSGEISPVSLKAYKSTELNPNSSLTLPDRHGVVRGDIGGQDFTIEYTVESEQINSVVYSFSYSDPDYFSWWKYSVSAGELTPISSRVIGPSYAIVAGFMALLFAMILHYLGRYFLKRRQNGVPDVV